MKTMKGALLDGKGIKSFNIPFDWDNDFGWETNDKDMSERELYARVAAVYRAVNLNAEALSSLPFVLLNKRGTEYDVSDDWKNKVGWMPNPKELLRLWRTSLAMTNSAYGFFERSAGITNLRYIVANTITLDVDEREGLKGYWRRTGVMNNYYTEQQGIIRRIWRLDYDTELLPSENTEFMALMSAAQIQFAADHFIKEFFKRGGIKPTMLMVKGMPSHEERTRIEDYWDRFIKFYYRVSGKVFSGETMEAVPVGDGIDSLSDNNFYKQATENIAMATGIPLSLLLANSANFATAETELKTWFDWSVIPWANFIAGQLNDNLWSDFGLTMQFRPEQVDPDAQETNLRADTYNILQVSMKKSTAAKIAGLIMPEDMEYEDLDEMEDEPEQEIIEEQEQEEEQITTTRAFTMSQYKELKDWKDVAGRKLKRGESITDMNWQVKNLPEDVAEHINNELKVVSTQEDLQSVFDAVTNQTPDPEYVSQDTEEIKMLAEALNKLANNHEPQINLSMSPINVSVAEKDVTVTPEVKVAAPVITVNVPKQPTPQVNVTNEVETPEVVVNNQIDVQPAEIKLPQVKRAKVKRNIDGQIDEIVSE